MATKTALALIVTGDDAVKINSIRQENDRAHDRWMPHVNFVFPFVPADRLDEMNARLQRRLGGVGGFDVHFDCVGHFKQKKAITANIQPARKDELQALFARIHDELSGDVPFKHAQFEPHLTLGQFSKAVADERLAGLRTWLGDGITVRVDSLALLVREDDTPFRVHSTIQL